MGQQVTFGVGFVRVAELLEFLRQLLLCGELLYSKQIFASLGCFFRGNSILISILLRNFDILMQIVCTADCFLQLNLRQLARTPHTRAVLVPLLVFQPLSIVVLNDLKRCPWLLLV